ncbi:hypothetical protein ABTE14_21060, partial [Acinetobacter baumannii]
MAATQLAAEGEAANATPSLHGVAVQRAGGAATGRSPNLQIPTFRPHEHDFTVAAVPDSDGRQLRHQDRGG